MSKKFRSIKPAIRTQKLLLIALALITLIATIPQVRARAWMYSPVSGRIGSVSIPPIYVGDLNLVSGLPPMFTLYSSTGPMVYRSPASTGTQTVKAKYLVEKWDGYKWVVISTSSVMQGQIASTGSSYRFPAATINPTQARGYFRFTWAFDWYNSAGTMLGSTFILAHLVSDHVCVTPYRLCQSYAGYFRSGGYLTNAW